MRERPGKCKRHGLTVFRADGKQKNGNQAFACKACRMARPVSPESSKRKNMLRGSIRSEIISAFGGKCISCGYSKSNAALHFHHRDGAEKSFQISVREMWRPRSAIEAEAAKCNLICANCHYELHERDGTMGPRSRQRLNESS